MGRAVRRCEADRFAAELNEMLMEIADGVGDGVMPVVERAGELGRETCTALAAEKFKSKKKTYAKGFRKKVKGKGAAVSCEVGNARLPGLVHLLEKGHATIGGGRVDGRSHVSDAAEVAFEELGSGIDELVGRVLG